MPIRFCGLHTSDKGGFEDRMMRIGSDRVTHINKYTHLHPHTHTQHNLI